VEEVRVALGTRERGAKPFRRDLASGHQLVQQPTRVLVRERRDQQPSQAPRPAAQRALVRRPGTRDREQE
jgi:hypothetical protein